MMNGWKMLCTEIRRFISELAMRVFVEVTPSDEIPDDLLIAIRDWAKKQAALTAPETNGLGCGSKPTTRRPKAT